MSEGARHVNNKGRKDPGRGSKIAAVDQQLKREWQKEYHAETPTMPDSRQVMRHALRKETKKQNKYAELRRIRYRGQMLNVP